MIYNEIQKYAILYYNIVEEYLISYSRTIINYISINFENKENYKYIILFYLAVIILTINLLRNIIFSNFKENKVAKYLSNFKLDKKKINKIKANIESKKEYLKRYLSYKPTLLYYNYIFIIITIIVYLFINYFTLKYNKHITNIIILFTVILILLYIIFFIITKYINYCDYRLSLILKKESNNINEFLDNIDEDLKHDLKKEIFKNFNIDTKEKDESNYKKLLIKYLKKKLELKKIKEYNKIYEDFYTSISKFEWCNNCFTDNNLKNNNQKECQSNCIKLYINYCVKLDNELIEKLKITNNKYFITVS